MIIQSNGQELQDFKVRLENILLMTDLKEPSYIIVSIIPDSENFLTRKLISIALKQEKINIIATFLLKIEEIFSDGSSEDYRRYAQMGLRLDPNHAFFLQRN